MRDEFESRPGVLLVSFLVSEDEMSGWRSQNGVGYPPVVAGPVDGRCAASGESAHHALGSVFVLDVVLRHGFVPGQKLAIFRVRADRAVVEEAYYFFLFAYVSKKAPYALCVRVPVHHV